MGINDEMSEGKKYLQKLKSSYLIISIAYVVLGLFLAIKPTVTTIICVFVGAVCLIFAVFNLIRYFALSANHTYFETDFIMSVILAIIGIIVIVRPDIVISILPTFVGIILVISGIVKLQNGINLKKMLYPRWQVVLGTALVSVIFGVVMLLNPFGTGLLLIRMVGVFFIVDGGMSIYSNVMLLITGRKNN